jgi:N-formylglutamate amidohydrolase
MTSPIVMHIPHNATWIPPEARAELLLDDAELEQEQIRMTDHGTELIFGASGRNHAVVVFPVSRLVVDPERFLDDAEEAMAARGMGVIYTRTSDNRPLRHPPSPQGCAQLIDTWYRPHHQALNDKVNLALARHPVVLLIDGHSFPNRPLPCDLDQSPDRPDICLGTDPFHTPDWLLAMAVEGFQACGYRVAINFPYKGTLVPAEHHQRNNRLLALMVEVNRRLYCDESTGSPHPGIETVRTNVADVLDKIAKKLSGKDGYKPGETMHDHTRINTAPGSLERAIEIALMAHAGQTDKADAPYILHPLRVMLAQNNTAARIAGVLHDVVEDGDGWTLERLRAEGFSPEVVEAVAAVTKRPEEAGKDLATYLAFVRRAAEHPVGRLVKRADLLDNCDLSRIAQPTQKDLARVEQYRCALELIDSLEPAANGGRR